MRNEELRMTDDDDSFRQQSKDVLRKANEESAVGKYVIHMGKLPDTHFLKFFILHS